MNCKYFIGLSGIIIHGIVYSKPSGLSEDLMQISHLFSTNPAKICGLYPEKGVIKKNADADLVIFRLNNNLTNIQSSESDCYEPYLEFKTKYDVLSTILNGKI